MVSTGQAQIEAVVKLVSLIPPPFPRALVRSKDTERLLLSGTQSNRLSYPSCPQRAAEPGLDSCGGSGMAHALWRF